MPDTAPQSEPVRTGDPVPTEVELKFENRANSQWKFSVIESSAIIVGKLRALCDLLDIEAGATEDKEIVDQYYDDSTMTLHKFGASFRRRSQNNHLLVTLKLDRPDPALGGLRRLEDEFECSKKQFQDFLTTPDAIAGRFREKLNAHDLPACGKLIKTITVHNDRTTVPLNTKAATYTFCYDKLYFYSDRGFSEYFAEIEIESCGDECEDPQIQKLHRGIVKLLGLRTHQKSKLERGVEWQARGDEDVRTVYSVGFDIVDYSSKSPDIQKQMIQSLNVCTKEAIRHFRGVGSEQNVSYLPTGDGMILVFDDKPETILPIVKAVQQKVKDRNRDLDPARRFEFRTGLHSGPVFRYSDVNENVNFAGNGINMVQRVMSLGDKFHILASKAGFEAMGEISHDNKNCFKFLGPHTVKHDEVLDIYNFFQKERDCGNPEPVQ